MASKLTLYLPSEADAAAVPGAATLKTSRAQGASSPLKLWLKACTIVYHDGVQRYRCEGKPEHIVAEVPHHGAVKLTEKEYRFDFDFVVDIQAVLQRNGMLRREPVHGAVLHIAAEQKLGMFKRAKTIAKCALHFTPQHAVRTALTARGSRMQCATQLSTTASDLTSFASSSSALSSPSSSPRYHKQSVHSVDAMPAKACAASPLTHVAAQQQQQQHSALSSKLLDFFRSSISHSAKACADSCGVQSVNSGSTAWLPVTSPSTSACAMSCDESLPLSTASHSIGSHSSHGGHSSNGSAMVTAVVAQQIAQAGLYLVEDKNDESPFSDWDVEGLDLQRVV